jgi:metal transporter CNNM
LPLRRRGNLLICTILLGNVAVNSILSIIMADLTSGIAGMLITTAIVLVFGEVIP